MAITLPLPVRVAAGIVATGLHLVRSLPEELPAIPVALVGNAMRLSMKVQQEITALATRGDELLGGLVGARPQESPTWATFDEDKQPARPAPRPVPTARKPQPARGSTAAQATAAQATAAPAITATPAAQTPATQTPATQTAAAQKAHVPAAEATGRPATEPADRSQPEASSLPDPDTTAQQAAMQVDDAVIELATHVAGAPEALGTEPAAPASDEPAEPDGSAADSADGSAADSADDDPEPGVHDDPAVPDGPAVLPGYDGMTLAQVRGHLRELTAADVSALLDYEQAGDNRAPFLTLLSNRLVTLGAQES